MPMVPRLGFVALQLNLAIMVLERISFLVELLYFRSRRQPSKGLVRVLWKLALPSRDLIGVQFEALGK